MYNSSPGAMEDFIKGGVWRDMKEELNAWITELQEVLSDPDGPKDMETISVMRGNIKACKNFLMMPEVLRDNMLEDQRHNDNEKTNKNWR